ncbi:MAG: transposase [Planctomycetes bacterium]|nr:transposase [Planctomycetota bacterium]
MRTKSNKPTPPQGTPVSSRKRRRFDASFKQEAVALAKRVGFSQAASELGVTESNLRNWSHAVASRGTQAFAPLSQRTDVEAELRKLREENRRLKIEHEILKKRRPSSRRKANEVSVHRCAQRSVAGVDPVRCAKFLPLVESRMAPRTRPA